MKIKETKKLPAWVVLAMGTGLMMQTSDGWGVGTDPFNSGLDQSFSAGYSQRSIADSFHQTAFKGQEEPKQEKGATIISRAVNVATTYDTNLFSDRHDPKDDVITQYTPTFGLTQVMEKGLADIFYDFSYNHYVENSKSNRFNQLLTTHILTRGAKTKFRLENAFAPNSAYAVGERAELRVANNQTVVAYSDNVLASLEHQLFPKTMISYTHRYSVFYYSSRGKPAGTKENSSQTHIFNPRVSYRITPKTEVHCDYQFETADYYYHGTNSSNSQQVGLGVSGLLGSKTAFSLDGSYRWRDYFFPSLKDWQGFEARAALSRQLGVKTSVTLWASHSIEANLVNKDIQSTMAPIDYVGANLSWKITEHSEIGGGASAGFKSIDGFLNMTDPDDPSTRYVRQQEDQFYEANVTWTWNPKPNFATLIGYKFFNKNSSFKDFEYDDQKIVASGRLKF